MQFPDRLSYADIERQARNLLLAYGQGSLPSTPISVERLAEEYLGLRLYIGDPADIGQPPNVLGAIFFEDNEVFMNEKLLPLEGRFNFTLGHEIGHDRMHRNVVNPLTYLGPFLKQPVRKQGVLCRDGDYSIVEVQANIFSACLLMPRDLVDDAVHLEAAEQGIWHDGRQFVYSQSEEPRFIGNLSARFHVSREAMQKRLKDLQLAVPGLPRQPRFF